MKRAIVLLLLLATPAFAQTDAMTAAADGFYAVSVAARPTSGGGIPDAAARARYAPLLTARLNSQLAAAAAAEARFRARHKNSPPLIEGDIFSSLFEGPTAWKTGTCKGSATMARCAITLTRADPGQKPVSWTDTLVLEYNGGWKVDDIAYDANFAFGNTGTLREMLQMAQAQSP